jgi:short-subunit dehydrogenase
MTLVLAARHAERLESVASGCRAAGATALAVMTDVRVASDVDRLIARTVAEYGRVDVVIANAGIGFHTSLAAATDDQLREIVDINILGVMRCARAAVPYMLEARRGHIITVSSVAVELMWPNDAVYGGTKAAVHRFALGLRNELKRHGIQVTDVIPGVIETPLTERLGEVRKAEPSVVAAAIVRTIRRPRAEVVTPRWYRLLLTVNRLFRGSINLWIGWRARSR